MPRVCDRSYVDRRDSDAAGGQQDKQPGRPPMEREHDGGKAPTPAPKAALKSVAGDRGTTPAGHSRGRRAHLPGQRAASAQAHLPGGAGGRSREPVVRRPSHESRPSELPGGPAPGGTRGCWATGAGPAGCLGAPCSNPSAAPTSCPGDLPTRPLPFSPRLLVPCSPCPWHNVNLSGSRDALAPPASKPSSIENEVLRPQTWRPR